MVLENFKCIIHCYQIQLLYSTIDSNSLNELKLDIAVKILSTLEIFLFFFLVPGFELRASCLLDRHSSTRIIPPTPKCLWKIPCFLLVDLLAI
jgi:hypothetical protein